MEKKERTEEIHRRNKPFNTAFKHFSDLLFNGSQKQMSEQMGIQASRLSEVKNDKKPVNEEMINALIRLSADNNMQIYSEYLNGYSEIMLLANVTDKEMSEVSMRKANPDYDTLKKRREESLQNPVTQSIDSSSAFNAAIAAHVRIIDTLESQLADKEKEMQERMADKDARIASLERTISDKEDIIRSRDARIADLERQLATIHFEDLRRFPFSTGVAENAHSSNVSPQQ